VSDNEETVGLPAQSAIGQAASHQGKTGKKKKKKKTRYPDTTTDDASLAAESASKEADESRVMKMLLSPSSSFLTKNPRSRSASESSVLNQIQRTT